MRLKGFLQSQGFLKATCSKLGGKMRLDGKSLEILAGLICGDTTIGDVSFPYRSGSDLTSFFCNLGLFYTHSGSTRKWWTLSVLEELNRDETPDEELPSPNLRKVIERLGDPREYSFESEKLFPKAIDALNKLLHTENLELIYLSGERRYILKNKALGTAPSEAKSLAYPSPLFYGIDLKFHPGFHLTSEGAQELSSSSANRIIKNVSLHPQFTWEQFLNYRNLEDGICERCKYKLHGKECPVVGEIFVWRECPIVKELLEFMGQQTEINFFLGYLDKASENASAKYSFPALIPQVWLELPPRDGRVNREITNQRVDFCFFWNSTNCIIEIERIQHYAEKKGKLWFASEERYAADLELERYLRRRGWKLFRFSNFELKEQKKLEQLISAFLKEDLKLS